MWERPTDRKLFAGVASGISSGLGVRKIWVRIAFIVLAVGAGVGFVLYGIGWLVMPREGDQASIADRLVDRANEPKEWVSIGLIVLGVLLLAGNLELISTDVILAGGMIAIGVILYTNNTSDKDDPGGPTSGGSPPPSETLPDPPEDQDPEPDTLDDAPAESGASSSVVGYRSAADSTPQRPRRSRKRRSRLPRLTFGVMLSALGALGLYDGSGGSVQDIEYVAVALGIVGAGVLVSSVWGRARWLLPLGLFLVPLLLLVSLIQVSVIGRWGEFSVTIDSVDEVSDGYHYGGGEVRFEFGEDVWSTTGIVPVVDVALGIGSVSLAFPSDVNVIVTARIGIGGLDTHKSFEAPESGSAVVTGEDPSEGTVEMQASSEVVVGGERTYRQSGYPGPTLYVNVAVGIGEVNVAQTEPSHHG